VTRSEVLEMLQTERCTARLEAVVDAWSDAEEDAREALCAWWTAPTGQKEDAYVVYRAALDREERAAAMLAAAAEAQR
jgi:hypothetical protein